MTRNFFTRNRYRGQRGFTLMEMIVVITIMSTLAASYAPRLVAIKQRQNVAREVAKNATMLIDAAKLYHYNDPDGDGADWPTMNELKNHNYINPAWSGTHSFGGTFAITSSGGNLRMTISALPADVQKIVQQSVPGWSYNAATLTALSVIPPPGAEPALAQKVSRSGDSMWGDLIMTNNKQVILRGPTDVNEMALDRLGLRSLSIDPGDLYLRGNVLNGTRGRVFIQSKNGTYFRNAANSNVAHIDPSGGFVGQDAYLSNLSNRVPVSANKQWVVYTGIHQANQIVTAPAIGGGYTNATYNIFVTPSFFEGATGAGQPVYPVTSVRCWAEKTSDSPPQWAVRMWVKDSTDRTICTGFNNQRMLVIITATI